MTDISEILKLSYRIITNLNMQQFLVIVGSIYATSKFSYLISSTYLLTTLNYEQEKLSYINGIHLPFLILSSLLIGKYLYRNPIQWMIYFSLVRIVLNIIEVNVLFAFYDDLKGIQFDVLYFIVSFLTSFWNEICFTCRMWASSKKANYSIASTHVTLFASFGNLVSYIPNFYTYPIVDYFNLEYPNLIGCILNFIIILLLSSIALKLDSTPGERWINEDAKYKSD